MMTFARCRCVLAADRNCQVKIASANKIPFLATAGGHGVSSTFGTLKNGIEIDLGHFNSINLDSVNNLVTVGGAVRLGQLFDPLYAAGKEISTSAVRASGETPCRVLLTAFVSYRQLHLP